MHLCFSMLTKTHLAVGAFFMLLLLGHVIHTWTYVLVFIAATMLPNIDSFLSGHTSFIMRPMRLFFKKRGFLHSFTFCFMITGLLAWFWPIIAFPFFLGYGIHLLLDSWTTEGIKPFWPLRAVSKGRMQTGGSLEHMVFYTFIIIDAITLFIVVF